MALRTSPSQSCCGMIEVSGISQQTVQQNLKDLRSIAERPDYKAFVMTGVAAKSAYNPYIEPLYEALKEKKWGEVWLTKSRVNPNTGNKIMVLIWAPNRAAKRKGRK